MCTENIKSQNTQVYMCEEVYGANPDLGFTVEGRNPEVSVRIRILKALRQKIFRFIFYAILGTQRSEFIAIFVKSFTLRLVL
jgi:hypothetical protein